MIPTESSNFDPDLLLSIAEGAARAAGSLLREDYWKPRRAADTGVNGRGTESGVASEQKIITQLHATFPTMSIVGEEGTHVTGIVPYTWWIDPLDGTYNFLHGVPRFSISIACTDDTGDVLAGVVYDPMIDECFCAIKFGGATRNGEPIAVSQTVALRDALAASGCPTDQKTTDNNILAWTAFVPRCQDICCMGTSALDLCYVAAGRFDLYWKHGLSTWDMAAGVLIAREAGGQVSDYTGLPFHVKRSAGLVASNGLLHAEAMSVFHSIRHSV